MPILDGAASADLLPNSQVALLNAYADGLARSAVEQQRSQGLAISELLGVIVTSGEEDVAGVAKASEVVAELLDGVPPEHRRRLDAFLARPVPPSHLRVVVWNAAGIGLMRVDTMPTTKGGAS